MKTPDERDEEQLLACAKQAVDLVDDQGLTPDEAVEKIARAERLTPGRIRLLCTTYNTGRQTHQREAQSNILDKLAAFPLADAGRVVARIYGGEKEAAVGDDYRRGPTWLPPDRRGLEKAAAAPVSLVERPPEPYSPDPLHAWRKACGAVERQKRAAQEAARLAAAAEDGLRAGVARLTGYFRKFAAERLPFAQVEKAAAAYLGPAAPALLELVYGRARLREKRAADGPVVQGRPVDLGAEPFAAIRECVKLAESVHRLRAAAAAEADKLAALKEEAFRPFGPAGTPPRGQPAPPDPAVKQAAGLLSVPAVGFAVGGMLNRGLGSAPKTKDELVEDAWLDLEDPGHQNELRTIRVQAMLNDMMTDPDDPISGYDMDKVLQAYNEIAKMAPRVAEQPGALKPLLRKRLSGMMEPFEAKEVTDIEKGLAASRLPTKNTSLLSDAPANLLG